MENSEQKQVAVVYTNWKGETKERHIVPKRVYWGHTEWHKEDQFLLECYDVDKEAVRTYAVNCIKEVKELTGTVIPFEI